MSLYNSYDRTQFLGEVNTPLDTQAGVLTTAQQQLNIRNNLGLGTGNNVTFGVITVSGISSFGNVTAAGFIKSVSPTGGIGYATGAGGAVTQLTSRTTGVTINNVVGNITMFSAAGSATPASFVVTNSTVGINDVIDVQVQAATNSYQTYVTQTGAGSFTITFSSSVGTAVDAPILNFSVTKGSAN